MFFFIGGIQPKTVTLDETPKVCPSCGLQQAKLKRIDHYFSLFFIPLFRVKKGEPVLMCENCNFVAPPDQAEALTHIAHRTKQYCPSCGYVLDPSFNYCPRCGTKV